MRYYYSNEYIAHHGIKGQKWGVRRFQNKNGGLTAAGRKRYNDAVTNYKIKKKAKAKKLANISKNKSVKDTSDGKRIEYLQKSVGKRYASEVGKLIVGEMITSAFKGDIPKTKEQVIEKVMKIGKEAAKNTAINTALGESAARKYTDSGRRKKGSAANDIVNREDMIQMGLSILPYATAIGKMTYGQTVRNRAKNEEKFKAWGGNILEAKFDDIVGLSENEYRIKD